jgi:hypothetical protein
MTRSAAFLLIKSSTDAYSQAAAIGRLSQVEWAVPVFGPHQVVAYASADGLGELTAFIESIRGAEGVLELDARMCKAIPGDEKLGAMAVPDKPEVAVLLIGVDHHVVKEREVTWKLREHPAVVWARAMWGPDDIVAIVEAPEHEAMRDVICDDVKVMLGVVRNCTLYAYPRLGA